MKTISKKQFLADVRTEVEALKTNAKPSELARLNFESFNPRKQDRCIYGQITGDCSSSRAKELMDKGCVRVTKGISGVEALHHEDFKNIKENINGEYTGQGWHSGWREYTHLSMVETYICLNGAKPENIIKYLKGEVDKLVLPLN